jgi:hypothetical protein
MMKRSLTLVAFLVATSPLMARTEEQPARTIRRLAPAAFPALPRGVRGTLDARFCTVPQWYGRAASHNVVAGAFSANAKSEWAVLCSVRDTSQILIVDAKTGNVVDSLERSADANWVQEVETGRFEYSRYVTRLPRDRIARWRTDFERRPIPRPIDHDALQQAFAGKGAEAFYFTRGRWYRQITAD